MITTNCSFFYNTKKEGGSAGRRCANGGAFAGDFLVVCAGGRRELFPAYISSLIARISPFVSSVIFVTMAGSSQRGNLLKSK